MREVRMRTEHDQRPRQTGTWMIELLTTHMYYTSTYKIRSLILCQYNISTKGT